MNRISYFQADKMSSQHFVSPCSISSGLASPASHHHRQDLQSTASSGIFTCSPSGWSVFGLKPPPSLSKAHCPSLPGAFAPARSHDQSVLSVLSPSVGLIQRDRPSTRRMPLGSTSWSLCGPLSCQPARAPPSCASPQPACRSLSAGYTKPHSQ